jgi:hypothetical protein
MVVRLMRRVVMALLVVSAICRVGSAEAVAATHRPPSSETKQTPTRSGKIVGVLVFKVWARTSPLPGVVSVVGGHGKTRNVNTSADGAFTVMVPPGTYTVSGHSPNVTSTLHRRGHPSKTTEATCISGPVMVDADATAAVQVVCTGR